MVIVITVFVQSFCMFVRVHLKREHLAMAHTQQGEHCQQDNYLEFLLYSKHRLLTSFTVTSDCIWT